MIHILTLGLKLLWLGRTEFIAIGIKAAPTIYLLGVILDSRVPTANLTQDAVFHNPRLETAQARSA
jgi:hypothetical protein